MERRGHVSSTVQRHEEHEDDCSAFQRLAMNCQGPRSRETWSFEVLRVATGMRGTELESTIIFCRDTVDDIGDSLLGSVPRPSVAAPNYS